MYVWACVCIQICERMVFVFQIIQFMCTCLVSPLLKRPAGDQYMLGFRCWATMCNAGVLVFPPSFFLTQKDLARVDHHQTSIDCLENSKMVFPAETLCEVSLFLSLSESCILSVLLSYSFTILQSLRHQTCCQKSCRTVPLFYIYRHTHARKTCRCMYLQKCTFHESFHRHTYCLLHTFVI